jgi:transposase
VSGCFRTRQYAEAYCRISSYLQTMAHRGYKALRRFSTEEGDG